MDTNKLREERQRRIAQRKASVEAKKAPAAKPAVTTASQARKAEVEAPAVVPAPAEAQQTVVTPAPETPVVETITANVLDPAKVSKSANFDISLYGATTANPHWLVVADGRPLGEIQYADQDSEQLSKDLFTSDTYGQSVVAALAAEGPAKILASLRGRSYQASVEKSEVLSALKQEVVAKADSEVRMARAELRANMLNVLGLVRKAHNKNFLQANDLKAELFDQLASVGMDERTAAHVIEAAWAKGADPYFNACFAQAEEWMDLPVEAYTALAKQIEAMPQRSIEPVTASADVPSAAYNVPVTTPSTVTASAAPATDYKAIFGF